MEYVAEVFGSNQVLERLRNCFRGPRASFGPPSNGSCELRSSEFGGCKTLDVVKHTAEALVREMRPVLAIYSGWTLPEVEIRNVRLLDDSGKLIRERLSTSAVFTVMFGTGLKDLARAQNGETLGARVLRLAAFDENVASALRLVGTCELAWATVYDIIEFLGGPQGVADLGVTSKREAQKTRQTANYHRHLGSPRRSSLPNDATSLVRATCIARDALKAWIEGRLG